MIVVWKMQYGYVAQQFEDSAQLDKYGIDRSFTGTTSKLSGSLAEAVEDIDPKAMKAYLWQDEGRRGAFVEIKL